MNTIDLSERKFYSFEQAAKRLNCSMEELQHRVIAGELNPSYFLPMDTYRQHQFEPHEDYDVTGSVERMPVTSTSHQVSFGITETKYASGEYFLVLPTRFSATDCVFYFAASKPFDFDIGDTLLQLPTGISLDEVMASGFVLHAELTRFENSKTPQPLPGADGTVNVNIPTETPASEQPPETVLPENALPSLVEEPPSTTSQTAVHQPTPEPDTQSNKEVDPFTRPGELYAANAAYQAVQAGYGDQNATFRNRIIAYLEEHYPAFAPDAILRIATVANPDKRPGRKKFPEQ